MIPGGLYPPFLPPRFVDSHSFKPVVHHTPSLAEGQLVAIRQYTKENGGDVLSPPLAVGRMALPSDQLRDGGKEKGKAVYVVHAWKDHLWEMGSKADVPEGSALQQPNDGGENAEEPAELATPPPKSPSPTPALSYTPEETTKLLLKSLLQAISTTLSSLPASSLPIPSTLLYTNHILPSRPAFPTLVLPPSALSPTTTEEEEDKPPHIDPTEISIKSSTHKSLSSFLKSTEKQGLLTLKSPPKHSNSPDILITSINASHPLVVDHQPFVTVGALEKTAARKAAREEREKEEEKRGRGEVGVRELWKPYLGSLALFEGLGGRCAFHIIFLAF
jgi:translation initiation factor 2D